MTGVRTGVSAQLKDLQPSLISVHCVTQARISCNTGC